MKRCLCFFVILILCCSTVSAAVFKDVSESHWAYEQIKFFSDKGIVNGIGDNKFAPNDLVTREQLAKMISILYNRDNYTPTRQAFTDVTPDMWSYAYIDSVKDYLGGYIKADGTSFYNPSEVAIREDVAHALVKICGIYNDYAPDYAVFVEFKDGDKVSYNRYDYLSVAVKSGLMQGYGGYLRPKDGITRAEAVTLLHRTIRQSETEYVPETEPVAPEKEEVNLPEVIDSEITYTVTDINGFEAWGYIRLNYGNVAVVNNSEFTFGEGNFTIEIIETENITENDIKCVINIYLDGETEADGISAVINDYNGENPQIISEDGKWNIKLKI